VTRFFERGSAIDERSWVALLFVIGLVKYLSCVVEPWLTAGIRAVDS
jgi:hypothetical protein